MIRHIVVWRLKEFAQGRSKKENARLVREKLLALQGRIPGLVKLEVGLDCGGTPGNWDVVLSSDFVSLQALEDYQTHPEHEAVKALVLAVREDRAVVDYEV